jgi:hypothetical protein
LLVEYLFDIEFAIRNADVRIDGEGLAIVGERPDVLLFILIGSENECGNLVSENISTSMGNGSILIIRGLWNLFFSTDALVDGALLFYEELTGSIETAYPR